MESAIARARRIRTRQSCRLIFALFEGSNKGVIHFRGWRLFYFFLFKPFAIRQKIWVIQKFQYKKSCLGEEFMTPFSRHLNPPNIQMPHIVQRAQAKKETSGAGDGTKLEPSSPCN